MLSQYQIELLDKRISTAPPGTLVLMSTAEMKYIKDVQGKVCSKCAHHDILVSRKFNPACQGCTLSSKWVDKKAFEEQQEEEQHRARERALRERKRKLEANLRSRGLLDEEVSNIEVQDGSAKSSTHYQTNIQPIEFMQSVLTPEEFQGFLKGNILKYTPRCGRKDVPAKEIAKIVQYSQWLAQAERGEKINPRI